jgi:hypothetical protein
MKHRILFMAFAAVLALSACGPSAEQQATLTSTAQTATAAMWTETFTPTFTFTSTFTPTFTETITASPTVTDTPTITFTPSITPSPTYAFPQVSVNVAHAACLYGPSKAFLWKYDLQEGDKGFVGNRSPVSNWLWVKFDRWPDYCWVSPFVLDISGDVKPLVYLDYHRTMPMTNALYAAPTNVKAERNGDQVTVTWDEVWMTEDDDRGYFIDVWVCQNGMYVWVPTSLPDQYHAVVTFTDQANTCSQKSGGQLYTVEKHGYPSPVNIPWPEQ